MCAHMCVRVCTHMCEHVHVCVMCVHVMRVHVRVWVSPRDIFKSE